MPFSDNCIYKGYCYLENKPEDCNSSCLRYIEMNFLLKNCGIPKGQLKIHKLKPEECDKLAFDQLKDIKTNIVNFVDKGKNLYLYSKNCGNGKSSWSIKLLLAYFNEIWYGNRLKISGKFINVPSLMVQLRENISNKDEEFERLLVDLEYAPLVVFDDIAACNIKDFDHLHLLNIIDKRQLNGLANIFNGNLEYEKLKNVIGERLASRVYNNSVCIELLGLDRRSPVGN